ncbi:SNF2 family domain-containing protein [Plectosphaerella plurivora]|uniref:SNF2 family domain-containing protein n=1 Tax=Plectosphaerella plurivora TaxID=936078 RepID=A0A9P8VKY0_9PEZI|nr:SNF2 family domain-containing protein [Plectosphaerella plurivora]
MPNNNLLRVPSGASTPGYSSSSSTISGNKRPLQSSQNLIDLTGPGPSKRPRGSPSPYTLPSHNRSHSNGSSASSVIDLTGNDDEVRASIDIHKKKAAEARRRNMYAGGQAYSNGNGFRPSQGGHNPWLVPTQPNNHASQPNWLQQVEDMQRSMPGGFPAGPSQVPSSANFGGYISSDEDRDEPSHRRRAAPHPSQRPAPPCGPQPPQRPRPSAVQDAISRVNMFDFENMTDAFGNPLDPRIANYARDVADDPRMSKSDIDQLLANIRPDMDIPEEDRADTPAAMTYPLYPHQKIALDWMVRQETGSCKGGILADDMGLGKTISMLSLIVTRQATRGVNFTDEQRETEKIDTSKPWFFTKTNLIVLPKALIRQWEDEIKRKLREGSRLSVVVFHGARKYTAKDLLKYDVVLTTYGTLLADHTRLKKFWKDHEGRNVNMDTDVTLAKDVCLFHPKHSLFWRVILDESQHIKNDRSKSAEAACQLMSYHRWCMSGTPMMNSLDELYPLLRFLRIAPYNNKAKFRHAFGSMYGKGKTGGDPRAAAMRNFQILLKATLLRRSKTAKLDDGSPIIVLPNKTEEVIHVTMAVEERKFYDELAANTKVTINEYIRKGTLGKHYSHVLELLLRLRQACCHPHLLDAQEAEKPEVDDSMLALARAMDPTVVERIVTKARELVANNEGGFECPVCYETISDPNLPLPCGHEICAPCYAAHVQNAALDNIHEGEEGAGAKCPVCRVILQTPKVVTFKAFKQVHLPDLFEDDDGEEVQLSSDESDAGEAVDSDSDDSDDADDANADDVDANGNLKDFINDTDDDDFTDDNKENKKSDVDDDEVSDDGIFMHRRTPEPNRSKKTRKSRASKSSKKADSKAADKTPKKKKKKARKARTKASSPRGKKVKVKPSMLRHLRKEGKKNKEARRQYRTYLKKNWLPSAKVTACLDLLRKIRDESDGEKTIIFSQWTMLMDFVEVALELDEELRDVGTVRFDGEMSMPERDRAVSRFRDDDRTTIMLVSLRAGNAGLNLVSASRVVILDPFWNPFIEMQAVDRAHRIGQQREVKVYRLLIKETVEDRIMEIKDKKEKMITSALDEGVAKKLGGLSVADLKRLFDV